jgi:hypothetical protein
MNRQLRSGRGCVEVVESEAMSDSEDHVSTNNLDDDYHHNSEVPTDDSVNDYGSQEEYSHPDQVRFLPSDAK